MAFTALERIEALVDDHSFVEIGGGITARATDFSMNAANTPGDGVITGHGLVDGGLIFVYAQDSEVLGGSIGEMHAKKIIALYDMAIKMGAPIVGLLSSSGIRIQESFDALESMASLFAKSAEASGCIPQVLGLFGNCGGALSVFAGLNDFVYMSDEARMFLQSPDTISGNSIEDVDTSSCEFQYEKAGNVDGYGSEFQVIWDMRTLLSIIPGSNREGGLVAGSADDMNRATLNLEELRFNIHEFCKEISDEHLYVPVREGSHPEMGCGFIRLGGVTVGVIGNQAKEGDTEPFLSPGGAKKAANFIKFCDAFYVPILSLVNVSGYESTIEGERHLPRALASLTTSLCSATVPKVTFYLKNAKGSAYLSMGAKGMGTDLVYAYPDIDMEIMKPAMAAKIVAGDLPGDQRMIADDFAKRHSGLSNAMRHGFIDRVVDFPDTRKYLIDAFGILFTKRTDGSKKHTSK